MSEQKTVKFRCNRCDAKFDYEFAIGTKQAVGCASLVYEQYEHPDWRSHDMDGPPPTSMIPVGSLFLQSVWGSDYDEDRFRILPNVSAELATNDDEDKKQETQRPAWLFRNASICDKCIAEMLDKGIIERLPEEM